MILNSKAPGLFLGLFLFTSILFASAEAKLHIAFVDSGFCNKSPLVKKQVDLTQSVKINCNKVEKQNRRFHGHFVLEKFLSLNKRKDLVITPLVVFDKDGLQKTEYWLKAMDWIKKNKVDLIVTASGLRVEKNLGPLPVLTIAASGQVSGKIRRFHKIWPQSFPSQNLILVGNMIREEDNIYFADNLLLNESRIDFYIDEESSSKAVAVGAARALNKCQFPNLKLCLAKEYQTVQDQITKKELKVLLSQ
ncbi:MAG: hypothetical protein EP326_10985 [Deltaproteobacteria bacterium]|nr:MAG: hypothetical protein EP326_10985 [Deltaproteobacteria bacterium]TNF30765.1 MAG: hypothetical protein EP319_04065 [Deltaproteobacteria bacterium]